MEKLFIESEIPQVLSSASNIVGVLCSISGTNKGKTSLSPTIRSICLVQPVTQLRETFLGRQIFLLHILCRTLVN